MAELTAGEEAVGNLEAGKLAMLRGGMVTTLTWDVAMPAADE